MVLVSVVKITDSLLNLSNVPPAKLSCYKVAICLLVLEKCTYSNKFVACVGRWSQFALQVHLFLYGLYRPELLYIRFSRLNHCSSDL